MSINTCEAMFRTEYEQLHMDVQTEVYWKLKSIKHYLLCEFN